MQFHNKIFDSSTSLNLYATPNPVKNKYRFLPEDKSIKIQKLDNNSYLTRQIFHAVQQGYLDFLQLVPKRFMKACLNVLEEKSCFSLLHFAVLENHKDVVLYLLSFKPDINIVASKKLRPIHLAAQKGNVEIVELLCSQSKIQIDAADDKGQTALHISCRRGHHDVVKILLKYGASVLKLESDKVSVMHHPVRRNDIEMIKTLFLYDAPLTIKNNNGQNPIMIAAIEGHFELFNLLFEKVKEKGANVEKILNEKDNDGHSCISYAVQNKNSEILKICCNLGADINTKQADGKTIFHTAAIIDYQILFDIIDTEVINLNGTDNDFNTPLHQAVLNNCHNMVQLLIKHGANINICNRKFQTPVLLACSEISSIKNLSEIIKTLINAKANLRIRDSRLRNVFHYIVEKENIEILKFIIRIIPSHLRLDLINCQDDSSFSPLHYSAKLGNIEICKVLLSAGSDPKLFGENDYLPLHIATMSGHLEVVKLLLEFDLDTGYFRDSNESSAIHLAAEKGKYEIFKYLIETGKDYLAKDEYGRNTLMFAARSGCLPIVEHLLKDEINVNLYDQMKVTALHQAAGEGHLKVVECLWSHGAVLTDDIYGQTPLDVAIINQKIDVVRFFLNDYNWKFVMSFRHKNGTSHIDNLIKHNESIAMELLDKCITENTSNKMDPNYEVKYWFGIIDAGPHDPTSINKRYFALQSMVKYKKLNLLKHPLSEKLIQKKWNLYGFGCFTVDLILHLIYVISLSMYVTQGTLITDSDLFDPTSGCKITTSNFSKSRDKTSPRVIFMNSLIIGILMVRITVKVFKILFQKFEFFQDFWNIVSMGSDTLIFFFIPDPNHLPCLNEWTYAPPALFLSYFYSLYFLQHFPMVGIHIIMFQKVLGTMIKVIISFSCLLIGFGFGFYIINSDQDPFKNIGVAIIKIIGMMIGEIDLVTYFISGKRNYLGVSLAMITLFLLIIPITLFNLIIGLAVGDIDFVASEAILEAFKLKVNYVWEVESKLPNFIQNYFYKAELYEQPKEKHKSSFSFKKWIFRE